MPIYILCYMRYKYDRKNRAAKYGGLNVGLLFIRGLHVAPIWRRGAIIIKRNLRYHNKY